MNAAKHIAYTTQVFETLRKQDDFLTTQQIKDQTKLITSLVTRSLQHLRLHKAVDAIMVDGVLWWFATPHSDTRIRVVQEKAHFKRRHRARKVVPGGAP